jgi:hypothetical protein
MVEFLKAIPVVSKVLDIDTDIPEIEKIESQYKLDRKKTLLIVMSFLLYFLFTNTIIYYTTVWFSIFSLGIPLGILLIILILSFFIKDLFDFSKVLMPLIFSFVFNFMFTHFLFRTYLDGFSFVNTILAILCITANYIFYWGIYETFRKKLTLKKEHDLTFVLVGGEVIKARLISITKRGDYIIEIPNNNDFKDSEILLNRLEIQKVIYRKEK